MKRTWLDLAFTMLFIIGLAIAIAVLMVGIFTSVGHASDCRVANRNVVVLDTGLTIAPFALPVGVPVVPTQTGLYSYNATAAAYQPRATANVRSADAELFEEFLAWKKARDVSVRATGAETAVFKACSKCHAGPSPKAGFGILGDLKDAERIKAIGEVITGRMPKGAKLSPEEVGKVLGELSGAKDKPAAEVLPQVQGEAK